MKLNTFQRWKANQKRRGVKTLRELARKIENGDLVLEEQVFWPTNLDNRIIFRFTILSDNSEQDIAEFKEF